jgi:hypothetical protein
MVLEQASMRNALWVLLFVSMVPSLFGTDAVITKDRRKFQGTVVKITEKGFVLRTTEGTMIVIPKDRVSKITRGNKVLDFDAGISYYLEQKRPFLPFIILSVASGAYAVKKFDDYKTHRDEANADNLGSEYTNLEDQSKKDMAWGIVSSLFCAGSVYVAFKPIEIKVPIGKIKLSMAPSGASLSLQF